MVSKMFNRFSKSLIYKAKIQNLSYVSYAVVSICVMVYTLQLLLESKYGSSTNAMIFMGGYYRNYVIILKDYYRFITYGFVHGGVFHLAMNLYALINLGTFLEQVIGHFKYFLTLLFSIIGGGLLAHLSGSELVVGLSGGLYGLLGLLIVIAYKSNWLHNPQIRNSFIRLLLINLLVSFMPSVSLAGHFGGLLIGILLGLVFTTPKNEVKSIFYYNKVVATILCLLILSFMAIKDVNIISYYSNDITVLQMFNDYGFDINDEILEIQKSYLGGK